MSANRRSSAVFVAIAAALLLLGSAVWGEGQTGGSSPAIDLLKTIPINGTAASPNTKMFSFGISFRFQTINYEYELTHERRNKMQIALAPHPMAFCERLIKISAKLDHRCVKCPYCGNLICRIAARHDRDQVQTFADGLATRDPREEPLAIIWRGAARILQLSEDDIAEAVRAYFQDTHNIAEGAGAASLAGLMQERAYMSGKRVAVILSGGNIVDRRRNARPRGRERDGLAMIAARRRDDPGHFTCARLRLSM